MSGGGKQDAEAPERPGLGLRYWPFFQLGPSLLSSYSLFQDHYKLRVWYETNRLVFSDFPLWKIIKYVKNLAKNEDKSLCLTCFKPISPCTFPKLKIRILATYIRFVTTHFTITYQSVDFHLISKQSIVSMIWRCF